MNRGRLTYYVTWRWKLPHWSRRCVCRIWGHDHYALWQTRAPRCWCCDGAEGA